MRTKKKANNDVLMHHSDAGYVKDLKHLCSLGNITPSKRDWIETTMLRLRETSNVYEKKFCSYLLSIGVDFIHQAPFILSGKIYFADFYIPEHHLIVEIDGDYHNGISQSEYDRFWDASFNGHKIKVLRLPNGAVSNEEDLNIFFSEYFPKASKTKNDDCTKMLYERLKKTFKGGVKRNVVFPICNKKYIASIAIKKIKTIVEVVDDKYECTDEDTKRDEVFSSIGYKTIRITSQEALSKDGKKHLVEELLRIKKDKIEMNKENKKHENTSEILLNS